MAESVNVAVVGCGYVGAVVAACLADLGNSVIAVEADAAKLDSLRAGEMPFFEPGLEELVITNLHDQRLRFTGDLEEAIDAATIAFICVGTPPREDGAADLSDVEEVTLGIAHVVRQPLTIVMKSTVPVGTTSHIAAMIEKVLAARGMAADTIAVASNPEFLQAGRAIDAFLHPSRIVIGSHGQRPHREVVELYEPIINQSFRDATLGTQPTVVLTDPETAELAKYAANAFLATKISFINEVSGIAERVGADVTTIAGVMGSDPRIGPAFLGAGLGWGGSCFGKDIDALRASAALTGADTTILEAAISVNDAQVESAASKLSDRLAGLAGKRVGVLGLAFKPGTDDTRASRATALAATLLRDGALVVAYDPKVDAYPGLPELEMADSVEACVTGADAVVLATDWPEFAEMDLPWLAARMSGDIFLDGRNQLDPDRVRSAGLTYLGIGRR